MTKCRVCGRVTGRSDPDYTIEEEGSTLRCQRCGYEADEGSPHFLNCNSPFQLNCPVCYLGVNESEVIYKE